MADKKKPSDNQALEHSQGGATTYDALDAGVPMLPGDPSEPVGPEDALGPGPKRGDYSGRLGADYNPHTSVALEGDELEKAREEGKPLVKLVPQRPFAEERGDEKKKKGGVQTTS